MNGAHLPHVDDRKIIRDRPASQCHAVNVVFGAARTERGDAQRTFTANEGAVAKNYELRDVQNRTRCLSCTTSARCPQLSAGTK